MANANNNFMRLGEARQTVVQHDGMPAVRMGINTYLVGDIFYMETFVFSMSGTQRTEKQFGTQEAFEAFLEELANDFPWTKGKLL
jgi:hypothetical protein